MTMTKTRDIPSRLNALLCAGIICAVAFQLFLMPLVLRGHLWAMFLIVALGVFLNTPFWSLIHEAIHKNFNANGKTNDWTGRFMSVLFGASFEILRFGHLSHHRFNRDWESEYYDPRKRRKIIVAADHYFKMLGGLYLTEVVTSFLIAILPLSLAKKAARALIASDMHYNSIASTLLKPEKLVRVRIDCVWIIIVYAASLSFFGPNWPVLAFLIAGRAVTISLMDNAYHYGTPSDNSVMAKELKTPMLFSRFILHFNHHDTHHHNPGLPWAQLSKAHAARGGEYHEDLIPALLAQFKGPIKIDADQKIAEAAE